MSVTPTPDRETEDLRLHILRNIVEDFLMREDVQIDHRLADLGADSLDLVEIGLAVECAFDVDFSDRLKDVFVGHATLRSILDFLNDTLGTAELAQ